MNFDSLEDEADDLIRSSKKMTKKVGEVKVNDEFIKFHDEGVQLALEMIKLNRQRRILEEKIRILKRKLDRCGGEIADEEKYRKKYGADVLLHYNDEKKVLEIMMEEGVKSKKEDDHDILPPIFKNIF